MKRKLKTQTDLSLKLAKRIKEELGIEVEPIINRTYSGSIQRSGGAWSWFMYRTDRAGDVGSVSPATEVLKAKKLGINRRDYLLEIYVDD